MNKFLKNTLPWILAAVLVVAIPIAWNGFNPHYDNIIYTDKLPTRNVTATPTENAAETGTPCPRNTPDAAETGILVINKTSLKIHIDTCYHAKRLSDDNKYVIETDNIAEEIRTLVNDGYSPCNVCCKKYHVE